MKSIIKIMILIISLLVVTSCSAKICEEEKTEFQKIYDVETNLVKQMSYEDFLEFTTSKTGVVFIGDESSNAKELAKIFCDTLCECDVNKAHFVKKEDITDDELLKIFDVKSLDYPIIVAYKIGKLVGFYDANIDADNLKQYIDDLIHKAYPTVCTEAC